MKYVNLGQIVKIQKGKKLEEVYTKSLNTERYIQIEDLRNDENIKYTSSDLKSAICDKNDILIAWDGANAGTIGFGLKGAIGSTLAKLTPIKEFFTPFVGRFLQSKFTYLRSSCTGATIPHISKSVLIKIPIPFPPLPEQKRIAEILDKADALRRKNKQILVAFDELLQSTFLDMFGDPVMNSKGWKIGAIGDLVSTINYGTSSKSEEEGKYPYLRMNNITYSGEMDLSNLKYINLSDRDKGKYLVQKGDLLFNRTNSKDLVGKTAVYRDSREMVIAGYIIRVRANEMANTEYISAFLNSNHGKKVLKGLCKSIVGMANINAKELQRIKILIPPISLQNQFSKIVENIEAQKLLVKKSLQQSEDLFNGLVQKAFYGEL